MYETNTKSSAEIIETITEYFKNNEQVFIDCVEDLDNYNGYLGDARYYSMDDLDEFYHDTEPSELLRRAFYGHDAETYITDGSGNREYGAFNPNREFFYYNGYGNLVSSDYKDYSYFLDDFVIKQMNENKSEIYMIESLPELANMFEELGKAIEQEAGKNA